MLFIYLFLAKSHYYTITMLVLYHTILFSQFELKNKNAGGTSLQKLVKKKKKTLSKKTTLAPKIVRVEVVMRCTYTVRTCDIMRDRLGLDIDATHSICVSRARVASISKVNLA